VVLEIDDLLWQAAVTVTVALLATWTFLVSRYWPELRPFGSRRTGLSSSSVIVAVAAVSSLAAVALPALVESIPPALIGATTPALLAAPKIGNRRAQSGLKNNSAIMSALSLMSRHLVLRLDVRLLEERNEWIGRTVARTVKRMNRPHDCTIDVEDLYLRLSHRQKDRAWRPAPARLEELRSHFEAYADLAQAARVTTLPRIQRERNAKLAVMALEEMLKVAYVCRDDGYVDRYLEANARRLASRA
jgi:hypothetical protein